MSHYENYATTSRAYDTTRVPVGLEHVLRALARCPSPPPRTHMLDAGCGTGNYLHAMRERLAVGVGVDRSEGMLARARDKLRDAPHIELRVASITALPLADASFDAILCTQVLHHLDGEDAGRRFPELGRALAELHRVARAGGVLVVNTSSHAQCRDGYWWAPLIEDAVTRITRRIPALDELRARLDEVGFEVMSVTPLLTPVLQGEGYFDPTAPLRQAWRDGDSTWSLTTDDELARALARIESMRAEGTLRAWFEDRERARARVGQTTMIVARKHGQG